MATITVLPHPELCPQGLRFEANPRQSLCDNLLAHGVEIEHACEKSCACTTCHVVIRAGFEALEPAWEEERDMLDKACGLAATSRLSCQTRVGAADLVVEIPRQATDRRSSGR